MNMLRVEVVGEERDDHGVEYVVVEHPSLPGGQMSVPVCAERPPEQIDPRPACCVSLTTMTLSKCADPRHNGLKVIVHQVNSEETWVHVTVPEMEWRGELPVCSKPKRPPSRTPEEPPGWTLTPNTFGGPGSEIDDERPDGIRAGSTSGARGAAGENFSTDPMVPGKAPGSTALEAFMLGRGAEPGRRYAGFSGDPRVVAQQAEYARENLQCEQGFSRNSKGWKPPMNSYAQYLKEFRTGGRLGIEYPPNVSDNEAGFNANMFKSPEDVVEHLLELGYSEADPFDMVRQFQSHYNFVSGAVGFNPRMRDLPWVRLPQGNVIADGMPNAPTLNALEIITENIKSGMNWESIVNLAMESGGHAYGRERVYSAKGW